MHNSKKITIFFCYEKNCGGESIATESIISELKKNGKLLIFTHSQQPLYSTGFFEYTKWIVKSIEGYFLQFAKIQQPYLTYATTYTAAFAALPNILTKKTKLIFHYHGSRLPDHPKNSRGFRFYTQLAKFLLVYSFQNFAFIASSLIITPSLYSEHYIKKKYLFLSKKNIIILPNGFDQTKYYPIRKKTKNKTKKELVIPSNRKILLYSGRLEPKKNIRELIDFVVKYNHKKKVHLLIVHSKPQNETESAYAKVLYTKIHDEHLSLVVTTIEDAFHDYPPAHIYGVADCIVSFSKVEIMPLVEIEAIACRIPYISPLLLKANTESTQAISWSAITHELAICFENLFSNVNNARKD